MISGLLRKVLASVYLILLLGPGGCTLPPVSDEDPLHPPTGSTREVDFAKTGQQLASLELTERGRQILSEGKIDQSISLFQKAISLDPRNPYAYYYFGQARFMKKEYEQILTPLDQARIYFLKERGWLSKVHTLRGKTFEALLRPDEARAEFKMAIKLDRRNFEAREGLKRLGNSG